MSFDFSLPFDFSLLKTFLGSISLSADLVTAISVLVSATLFIRNQKLEKIAARRQQIGESARAPIIDYLFKKIEPLSNHHLDLKNNCERFRDPHVNLSLYSQHGETQKVHARISDIHRCLIFDELISESVLSDHRMGVFSDERKKQQVDSLLKSAQAALNAGKSISELMSNLRLQLYPVILTLESGDILTNEFNSYIKNQEYSRTRLAYYLDFLNICTKIYSGEYDDVPLEEIFLKLISNEYYSSRSSLECSGLEILAKEKFDCGRLNYENYTYHEIQDYLQKVVKEVLVPAESSIGRKAILTGYVYMPMASAFEGLGSEIESVQQDATETVLGVSALLHVLIRDNSSWKSENPIKEASEILIKSDVLHMADKEIH